MRGTAWWNLRSPEIYCLTGDGGSIERDEKRLRAVENFQAAEQTITVPRLVAAYPIWREGEYEEPAFTVSQGPDGAEGAS